jgi:amino acid adenylation domain-containing protein
VLHRGDEDFRANGYHIHYKDFTKLTNKQEQVQRYIDEDAYQVFDLVNGPLLRAALLQVEKEHYVFYFNMHHIISDGWSMGVVSKELFAFYKAYQKDKKAESKSIDPVSLGLKELRIQYKDYSAWQLAQLQEEEFAKHRNYWLNNLSGKLPLLELPGRKQRPKLKTNNGRMLSTYLNKESSRNLKKYSQANGGTLFMGLLASLNTAFYLYSWQTDQIIGSPVAGRAHLDLEDQIGFYVNTLALRTNINPDENFDELFSKVKQATLESYAHQIYPFDKLVDELELVRDTSRSAVFDVMLVLQNNGENTRDVDPVTNGSAEDYLDRIVDLGSRMTKFDLLINVQEQGNYLHLAVEYNTDVYEKELIERFIDHYKSIVLKVTSDPTQQLGEIDYLSAAEKQELLYTFNDTAIDYGDKTVMKLVEEQAARTPDKIALEFEEKVLTYGKLNEHSNCLAHVLKDSHQQSNTTRVGVMLERSLESVIAMIGVMKTGACYVPIDHEYPTERVKYIIEDSALDIIVSREQLFKKHNIQDSTLVDIKSIDLENGVKSNPETTNQPDDGSYVIYTSGSTGKPKGVLQTHRMMSNLIQWDIHHSGIATGLKYLQYASFSFDASLHDLYFILSCGGSAYIVNEASRLDYPSLKEQIIKNGIEVISMPFSALNAFCIETNIEQMQGHNIKYIVSTAEQLYVNEGLKRFLENNPGVELHNHYGPSESHVVTSYRMSPEMNNMVSRASIGKPISNSTIYIVNAARKLVPIGVEGEVYIGGANLATGYLNKEALTKERFVDSEYEQGKLYKTGDQAYWRPDGNIEYIGRKDDQVKIRGYRIELGEIEHALQSHKEIEEAVVLAREYQDKEKELVAYITSKQSQNTTELRTYLKGILPDYMLPVHYVQLESLPLTGNGKIDKRALPDPQGLGLTSGIEYMAPRNVLEEKLVKIWQEVLQRDTIGVKDDFFALGGHSLKAVRLSAEYQKELAVKITLKDLFANTTIASHVELMEIQNWVESDSKQEILEKETTETFNF